MSIGHWYVNLELRGGIQARDTQIISAQMAPRTLGQEEPGKVIYRNGKGAGSTRTDACRSVSGEGTRFQ